MTESQVPTLSDACRYLTEQLAEFFFSSRRRHTRWTGDWSSDVCSSDLIEIMTRQIGQETSGRGRFQRRVQLAQICVSNGLEARSEERRVGKECRSRRSTYY